jgi:Family of unknown function (DUF6455)
MDDQNPTLAWNLTRGMARVLGINLIEAVTEGWYSRAELDLLMAVCEGCDQSERCMDWLGHHPRAEALPHFCHNKHEIESLAP